MRLGYIFPSEQKVESPEANPGSLLPFYNKDARSVSQLFNLHLQDISNRSGLVHRTRHGNFWEYLLRWILAFIHGCKKAIRRQRLSPRFENEPYEARFYDDGFHCVDLSAVNFKPQQGNSGGTAIFGGILHPKPSNIKHLFPVGICENFQLY